MPSSPEPLKRCLASMIWKAGLLLALLLCFLPGAALAQECRLVKMATLETTIPSAGPPTVILRIADQDARFALNTATVASLIGDDLVAGQGLNVRTTGRFDLAAGYTSEAATIPLLDVGGLRATDLSILVAPSGAVPDGVDGVLGLDLLHGYDIELDLGHGKLNLFNRNHCPGHVVYWTSSAAVLPIHIQHDIVFTVPMTLDGKPVEVLLDTGTDKASMSYATAHRLFGLERGGPALQRISQGPGAAVQYRYAFKTLEAGGLVIANPEIEIDDNGLHDFGDNRDEDCNEKQWLNTGSVIGSYRCLTRSDLRLGVQQLRQLRLFIALSEETLYLTSANAQ